MLIHVIGDYGPGDLSFAEVTQQIMRLVPDAHVSCLPVPAFSTIAAGFCAAQLGMNEAPKGMLIFQNVAPRDDDHGPRRHGAGEPLVYAELPNGVRMVGVMSGYCFSFLKHVARSFRRVDCAAEGSQFRSRDIFPEALGRIVRGDRGVLLDEIPRDRIPDIPSGVIGYVDGFGNIKTTHTLAECSIEAGRNITINIGNKERIGVMVREQNFAVAHGELCITPGSSGWTDASGKRFRFLEVFLRGGSAWEAFGHPPIGTKVEFAPNVKHRVRPQTSPTNY